MFIQDQQSYVVPKNSDGKFLLSDGQCNISLGFLEGILNTKDGKAMAEIYEHMERVSYDTEAIVRSWRSGFTGGQ